MIRIFFKYWGENGDYMFFLEIPTHTNPNIPSNFFLSKIWYILFEHGLVLLDQLSWKVATPYEAFAMVYCYELQLIQSQILTNKHNRATITITSSCNYQLLLIFCLSMCSSIYVWLFIDEKSNFPIFYSYIYYIKTNWILCQLCVFNLLNCFFCLFLFY